MLWIVNSMKLDYKQKCDNCRKDHPSISVIVNKDMGNGVGAIEFWCLKCLDTEISKQQIIGN